MLSWVFQRLQLEQNRSPWACSYIFISISILEKTEFFRSHKNLHIWTDLQKDLLIEQVHEEQ